MADSTSSFWGRITTWLVKSLWPWIIKNIWPFIQAKIIGLVISLVDKLIEKLFTPYSEEKQQKAEEAFKRAAEASKKAETAQNEGEAEAYRELAKRLQEMGEHYEQEIKNLRQRLDALAAQATEDFEEGLDELNLDQIIKEHNGKLQLEGEDLPPLPPPSK